jgi:translation initiation factor 3 subunit M
MAVDTGNQVFIDGSFEDLAEELAAYIDNLRKVDEDAGVRAEVALLLKSNKKDEVLKRLVTISPVLNAAPEKEFSAAYNLLIYLVVQSPNVNMFLPKVCENLSRPITSSPANGHGLALSVLTTLFNLLRPDNEVRFNVFLAILRHVKASGLFEALRSQLSRVDTWIEQWDIDEEDQRKLFCQIADIADDAGEEEWVPFIPFPCQYILIFGLRQSYQYILRALRTFDPKDPQEISSTEAQKLSLRALKCALLSNTHYDFHDLTSLPAIQALSDSHPTYAELLEVMSEKELEDYSDFRDEHEGFIEENGLDNSKLHRKMRLLTLASLAASTNSRELEYKRISKALQVPPEDVEMWVIDVIRAGLVEGKLSQQKQTFLIHRTTYRVFGEKQWREVATRLDTWKESLRGVLDVVRRERQQADVQKEREMHDLERKMAGAMAGGRRVGGRDTMVDVGAEQTS